MFLSESFTHSMYTHEYDLHNARGCLQPAWFPCKKHVIQIGSAYRGQELHRTDNPINNEIFIPEKKENKHQRVCCHNKTSSNYQ